MLRSTSRRLAAAAPEGVPLARDLVRAGLGRVFGPPPFDTRRDPGDPGLFGPGSASWRVVAEPAAIAGGVRALLVQLLHPLAMAGVADHSQFRDDPLGRLQRTSGYVTTTTFGSTREALAVAGVVRRTHAQVGGVAPDGRPYAADDPHLLAWVSIALTSSFLATDRAYAPRPVDEAAADAFVAEQSRAAALLDPRLDLDALEADADARTALRRGELSLPMLDEGLLPRTEVQLRRRLADYRPELRLDDTGRQAVRFLLWPRLPPPIKAGYLPLVAGALATLEPEQRRIAGLSASRVAVWPLAAQARATLTTLRVTTGVSPSARAAADRAATEAGVA
jgi:uncharacterized protein (DUF2236 family)